MGPPRRLQHFLLVSLRHCSTARPHPTLEVSISLSPSLLLPDMRRSPGRGPKPLASAPEAHGSEKTRPDLSGPRVPPATHTARGELRGCGFASLAANLGSADVCAGGQVSVLCLTWRVLKSGSKRLSSAYGAWSLPGLPTFDNPRANFQPFFPGKRIRFLKRTMAERNGQGIP